MAGNSWSYLWNSNNWKLALEKTNVYLNLINNEPDVNKIYLYVLFIIFTIIYIYWLAKKKILVQITLMIQNL